MKYKYRFDLICPKCGIQFETISNKNPPHINCGNCLMAYTEVVEMKVLRAHDPVSVLVQALKACIEEMKTLNEPCNHSVGVCWCSFHRALEQAESSLEVAQLEVAQ